MSYKLKDLIAYRIEKAHKTIEEAKLLFDDSRYNAVVNRLYYACFYSVLALLATKGLASSKHKGVRMILNKEFVKAGDIESEWYKFYARLFNNRQESDYEDFKEFEKEEVEKMYQNSIGFIAMIEDKTRQFILDA